MLARLGGRGVFVARWVAFARTLVPAAGRQRRDAVPAVRAVELAGAVTLGRRTSVLAGYLAGESYRTVSEYLGKATGAVLLLILPDRRDRAGRPLAGPQPGPGAGAADPGRRAAAAALASPAVRRAVLPAVDAHRDRLDPADQPGRRAGAAVRDRARAGLAAEWLVDAERVVVSTTRSPAGSRRGVPTRSSSWRTARSASLRGLGADPGGGAGRRCARLAYTGPGGPTWSPCWARSARSCRWSCCRGHRRDLAGDHAGARRSRHCFRPERGRRRPACARWPGCWPGSAAGRCAVAALDGGGRRRGDHQRRPGSTSAGARPARPSTSVLLGVLWTARLHGGLGDPRPGGTRRRTGGARAARRAGRRRQAGGRGRR